MLFSSSYPLHDLALFSRMLRHGLAAGLSLVDVFRQQSTRGPISMRPMIQKMTVRLEQGDSLEEAITADGERLPVLFKSLAVVGEQTGHLPDIFHELERYFELQSRLRRQFITDITWPVVQFVMAVGVIALMLLVLGWLGSSLDPLGLGLTGSKGALAFVLFVAGALATAYAGYRILSHAFRHRAGVERTLLSVPSLGPCLEAICLGRFCVALRMTMGAGLNPRHALSRSLDATGNAAYTANRDDALAALKRGDDFTSALKICRIFPQEFLDIVANAEEGGRIPEVMEHQSQYYQEEASRRMTTLTKVAGFAVWLFVAMLLITAIFRIFTTAYLGQFQALGL